ncbi:hypothetical protein COY52_05720 [Candidatus Desantisbacteria bacterium CG_4_10_14_0_8_um_filter_48_22]|uniref:Uncharacterized protein n=1 Tax=Candidatus Desantisbacteria bacterium CG_4_10_14_0_8_um_filter_48_22 TaxID=1974543 RepID=A0A2M7SBR1_9BACT|nr:MAG: hypothetical protein AUJ67_06070 [Candidatus Desantisbacteria bacterium CG1_02_49_89]PIV56086.1 MAG: hypothetical protein COS16_04985 [Candidatus Desantisbacteria bacterium CG02_land_8_20_14_3_00_49_13]PIZ16924.1 MAG: hypothetical protein COY52_05720 [Candidatus Desantisbacteria bacterium CG_4_10_14_0_8_um_filter_48_22]
MDYKIVVLDIGKTNKKIVVFSKDLKILSRESTRLGDKLVKGVLCDRIYDLNRWVLGRLKAISGKHRVKVISATTYGATIACIGKDGDLAFPVVSYMHEPGEKTRKKFYSALGSAQDLYVRTATPLFEKLLSVGMQLFWLKEKRRPDFNRVKNILFLPQYEGYVLTGKKAVELTSVGCHTYLYDFCRRSWSETAKKLGATGKFPARFSKSWDDLGRISPQISRATGLAPDCAVSVGIHDSNASLLPYLLAKKGRFILVSTGTWGIHMFSGSSFYLSPEDMKKDTLYYLDVFGRPVRAARTAMGMEHDHYSGLIEKKFGFDPRSIKPDAGLIKEIISENKCFIIPTVIKGTGQFQDSKPGITDRRFFYRDARTAYTVLNISLALQSYFAIKQAFGREESKSIPVYVEGGFRNNGIYLNALSALFTGQPVVATEIQEATALGAAICGKCAAEGISPRDIDPRLIKISEKPVSKLGTDPEVIRQYIISFERHCLI